MTPAEIDALIARLRSFSEAYPEDAVPLLHCCAKFMLEAADALAALKDDAERYRFWRAHYRGLFAIKLPPLVDFHGERKGATLTFNAVRPDIGLVPNEDAAVDAAIDAARAEKPPHFHSWQGTGNPGEMKCDLCGEVVSGGAPARAEKP